MVKFCAVVLAGCTFAGAQQSRWVHPGADGRLVYARSPQGDSITDFSYAGYRGGGVTIPKWPATQTVAPSGGDDTVAIQAAIDTLSKLPPDKHGHRGSVWLAPGVFHCAGTLKIVASGVVLHGAGPVAAQGGTTIELTGKPHLGIEIAGEFHERVLEGSTTITDAYVPSGTNVIHVADTSAMHAGDTLQIVKPVTATWVKFMGMDQLSRSDREEKWVTGDLKVYRRVAKVDGNSVTLEVPLTDDIDAKFLEGKPAPVSRVEIMGRIAEVGVEGFSVVAPARSIAYQEDAEFDGLKMGNAVDSWIRSVHFGDTTNSVAVTSGTERVTVQEVNVEQKDAVTSSAKNFAFSANGTQILFDRISGKGDSVFFFATQARQQGPVVVLNCRFLGDGRIEPHQRWSTGLLVDGCEVPGGGISLQNRGTMGSGHGWTIGWSVLWNNKASTILVQNPPGVANWSIGDRGGQISAPMPTSGKPKGADLPRGLVESSGKPVAPASLYLQQLRERLGDAAVKTIGY